MELQLLLLLLLRPDTSCLSDLQGLGVHLMHATCSCNLAAPLLLLLLQVSAGSEQELQEIRAIEQAGHRRRRRWLNEKVQPLLLLLLLLGVLISSFNQLQHIEPAVLQAADRHHQHASFSCTVGCGCRLTVFQQPRQQLNEPWQQFVGVLLNSMCCYLRA
jgi:hypothetical protein